MDSWPGPQATDNAAGSACIFELARAFARHRERLRLGLTVGLWMGHETGTMISSSRFADTRWDRLRQGCVAYLQIDQPAIVGSSVWRFDATDEAADYLSAATRAIVGDAPIHLARMRRTGDTSFFGVGLPTIAGITSFTDAEIQRTAPATLGWFHHSLENTLDKVDRGRLAEHLRVYAAWMWGLMTDPLLPFAYGPMARRIAGRIGTLAARPIDGIDLGTVHDRARDLAEAAERFDTRVAAERGRLASGGDDAMAERLSEAMLGLSRVLVPLTSTVAGPYGQDRYGHAWQGADIPALEGLTALAALSPESEAYRTGWVAAIRARNRVADALEDAAAIARRALDEVGA
jgi:hypothetical protein